MLREKSLVPVDGVSVNNHAWYFLFFATKTAKQKVVYNGAAQLKGRSFNQAVLAGENLLNDLNFSGRFDSLLLEQVCFQVLFQVKILCDQQDWYSNNGLDYGKHQIFWFNRHVWGITSSS